VKKKFLLSCLAFMMLVPFSFSAPVAADDDQPGNAAPTEEKSSSYRLPEYWLGIRLRMDEQGVIVQEVVPDSPAAKAGFAQNDVIVKANDKKITDVYGVLQAVEAAKDKEMKVEITRDGQSKTLAVTPTKRPEEARITVLPPGSDFETFRKWVERLPQGRGNGPDGPMQFRFFHPGVILPKGAPIHPPLPENMSISITKTGDKPADIVVKMGDEHWEVTEKDLDKLPEKVRPYVDQMLGLATSTGSGAVRWVPEVAPPAPPEVGIFSGNNLENRIESRIEKRLDEMKQQIDRLENELRIRRQDANKPEPGQTPEKNKEEPQGKTAF
jgi:membrane-associated protease RseP (regulator of RpoE activity)